MNKKLHSTLLCSNTISIIQLYKISNKCRAYFTFSLIEMQNHQAIHRGYRYFVQKRVSQLPGGQMSLLKHVLTGRKRIKIY